MATVLRSQGFRVVIFSDDHEPAHVHVFGDGEAKVKLGTAIEAPELVWAVGMSKGDVRKVMKLVGENNAALVAAWERLHG